MTSQCMPFTPSAASRSGVLGTAHTLAPVGFIAQGSIHPEQDVPQTPVSLSSDVRSLQNPHTVHMLGAGLALGQPLQGVERAPQALRVAGLQRAVLNLGWGFVDEGDLVFPQMLHSPVLPYLASTPTVHTPKINNAIENGRACQQIAARCKEIGLGRNFCLTVGGDHSIALGSLAGLLEAWPEISLIWVDAHGDFNTPDTSPTGNFHGMPLAALTGAFPLSAYPGFEWFTQRLPPQRVALVGVRSLDQGERQLLRTSGIHVFTMTEIDRFGIGRVMELALAAVNPDGTRPLHLSLDIDALDPSIAPNTGTRVRGGLNYREAHYIAEAIAETGRLVSMDMVEVNPVVGVPQDSPLGPNDPTTELALELLESALGKRILSADGLGASTDRRA